MGVVDLYFRIPSEGFERFIEEPRRISDFIDGIEDWGKHEDEGLMIDIDKAGPGIAFLLTEDPLGLDGDPPKCWVINGKVSQIVMHEENYYSYLLPFSSDSKLFFVHYDDLAKTPCELRYKLGECFGIQLECEPREPFDSQKTRAVDLDKIDAILLNQANEVYEKLKYNKIHIKK